MNIDDMDAEIEHRVGSSFWIGRASGLKDAKKLFLEIACAEFVHRNDTSAILLRDLSDKLEKLEKAAQKELNDYKNSMQKNSQQFQHANLDIIKRFIFSNCTEFEKTNFGVFVGLIYLEWTLKNKPEEYCSVYMIQFPTELRQLIRNHITIRFDQYDNQEWIFLSDLYKLIDRFSGSCIS